MRFRNIVLVLGSLVTVLALVLSDPSGGAVTATFLMSLAVGFIAVGFAHLCRKALFDYIDMQELFDKAKKSSIGSGIAFAGICVVIASLLTLFSGRANGATDPVLIKPNPVVSVIPAQARGHLPTLIAANKQYWPTHPNPQT